MLLFFSPVVVQQTLEVGNVLPVTVSDNDAVRRTEVPYGVLEVVRMMGNLIMRRTEWTL